MLEKIYLFKNKKPAKRQAIFSQNNRKIILKRIGFNRKQYLLFVFIPI